MQAGPEPYGLINHGSIIVAGEHIQSIGTTDFVHPITGDLD